MYEIIYIIIIITVKLDVRADNRFIWCLIYSSVHHLVPLISLLICISVAYNPLNYSYTLSILFKNVDSNIYKIIYFFLLI